MSLHGVVMYQTRPADETLDALSNFLPIYFITPCWWGRYQNSNNARPTDQYGSCTLFLKINLLEIQRTESLINWSKYVPRDLRNSSSPQPGPPGPFGGSGPPLTIPRIEQILSKWNSFKINYSQMWLLCQLADYFHPDFCYHNITQGKKTTLRLRSAKIESVNK